MIVYAVDTRCEVRGKRREEREEKKPWSSVTN